MYEDLKAPQMFALFVSSKNSHQVALVVLIREIQDYFLACLEALANPETRQPRTKAAICTCAR